MDSKFTNSIVALVTPMQANSYQIDYQKFTDLINWHIEQGTSSIVVAGSTGEAATLEIQEWIKLLETAVTATAGKLPIIAGVGSNCTKHTIEKTILAEKIGANAALVVTPYYNKPTQAGLELHFTEVANSTELPIILYNVPSRTGCDLLDDTTVKLSQLPNIIGIKDATGDLTRAQYLLNNCADNFTLLSGDDSSFVEFMLLGGHGVMSVAANVLPTTIAKICNLAAGNSQSQLRVRAINTKLASLYSMLMVESNPIPVKWLLHHLDKIAPVCRLPLTTLSEMHHADIVTAYQDAAAINLNITEACI
jgi:4-hydroxy-tetrahydrodipicolinate synthase